MQMVELEKLFSNKIQKIVSNHYKNQFYCWNKRKRILKQEALYVSRSYYENFNGDFESGRSLFNA